MLKRILTLTVAAVLALAMLVPAAGLAEFTMYVYTPNGRGLNIRTQPTVGDNIIKSIPFGEAVTVHYHLGNGWTALLWDGESYDHVYVQTRFLVDEKPKSKPTPSTPEAGGNNAGTIAELNAIFKTYRSVPEGYSVTVHPTRGSGWVNMRFAPSKQSELMATYRNNDQLVVIGELKDWYQVEDPATGNVGYISTKFVKK